MLFGIIKHLLTGYSGNSNLFSPSASTIALGFLVSIPNKFSIDVLMANILSIVPQVDIQHNS